MSKNPLAPLSDNLGEYLKEQRQSARLSVRQLSDLAGISNPYLSQIERGVKRPSAEILQQIAKGLSISAETLYVQAGLLDPSETPESGGNATRTAIRSDAALTSRQRQTLLEIYDSFVGATSEPAEAAVPTAASKAPATTQPATKKSGTKKPAARTSAGTKAKPAKKSTATKAKKTTASTAGTTSTGTSRRRTSAAGTRSATTKTSGATGAARTSTSGRGAAAGRNRRSDS
ncbi:helix-turn-helix domain-containing protein [Janibacter alkaliphilus]|uniref:Transcriptional regulator with XRE-family HTH domain n=1 Tax=Janibacter alkaliphilus TaxID=1069963 RepID=A0A852X661_9MICO|nr:helix-turn-helix transcriptional regulator [Janibacter alkaliphilus]NYG36920.1 transcriptional regulator with XRE-family HTH domain [Janibacter alkaliphilus]